MSNADSRTRQYAGLALVVVAYLGGIIGWSWATLTVESEPAAPDTTHSRVEMPPDAADAPERETPATP